MRALVLILISSIIFWSCDKKLTKEQRAELREKMESREIKKISQDEIYNKAMEEGKRLMSKVQSERMVDSINNVCNCELKFYSSTEGLDGKSKQVFEAYEFDPAGEDNIQKQEDELLIYSSPVMDTDTLKGVWFIKFQKKEIVKML